MARKRARSPEGHVEDPPRKFRRGVANDLEDDGMNGDFEDPFASDAEPVEIDPTPVAPVDFGKKKFLCPQAGCGHRCDRISKLENHIRMHTGEKPFKCDFLNCISSFSRQDHLIRHKDTTHGVNPPARSHVCTWIGCTQAFDTRQHLNDHMKRHEAKFHCTGFPPCNQEFRKEHKLQEHIAKKHGGENPYRCAHVDQETGERCKSTFKAMNGLRQHENRMHNPEHRENSYMCTLCPRPGTGFHEIETDSGPVPMAEDPLAFATYQELANHNREVHPPVCSTCGFQFKSFHHLKMHCETVHSEPKILCTYPGCESKFKQPGNLTVHLRVVHGKEKWVCDPASFVGSKKAVFKDWDGRGPGESAACGASFTAKASLEQHVRQQHIEYKSRKESRQAKKAALRAAGKIPSKAKPEPSMLRMLTGVGDDGGRNIHCREPGCDHKFFFERDLRRHMRAVHKFNDQEIEEKILEANALEGGQFWVSHAYDPILESAETTLPPTPDLFQENAIDPNLDNMAFGNYPIEKPMGQMRLSQEEMDFGDFTEAAMDEAMGIHHLHAFNVGYGLPN